MEEVKIDKRTKAYKDSQSMPSEKVLSEPSVTGISPDTPPDFSKSENNPGWTVCMKCGGELPPNEDGSKRYYRQPTPCDDCVKKNYGKAIIGDKEVDIDPTDSPKAHFEDDGRGGSRMELKDSKGKVYK